MKLLFSFKYLATALLFFANSAAHSETLYQSASWAHLNDQLWVNHSTGPTTGTYPNGRFSPFTIASDSLVAGIDLMAVGIDSPHHGFYKDISIEIWDSPGTQLIYSETFTVGQYGYLNHGSTAYVNINFTADVALSAGAYKIGYKNISPQGYFGADDIYREDAEWDGSYPGHHLFSAGAAYQLRTDRVAVVVTPEPETYAMLLAGLCMIGFAAKRRKDIVQFNTGTIPNKI